MKAKHEKICLKQGLVIMCVRWSNMRSVVVIQSKLVTNVEVPLGISVNRETMPSMTAIGALRMRCWSSSLLLATLKPPWWNVSKQARYIRILLEKCQQGTLNS